MITTTLVTTEFNCLFNLLSDSAVQPQIIQFNSNVINVPSQQSDGQLLKKNNNNNNNILSFNK
jgi:hypothetical protein